MSDYNVGASNYIIDLPDKSGYAGYSGYPDTPNSLHQTNRSQVWIRPGEPKLPFVTRSVHLRECFAECLGTFVLVCFGLGVNNQVSLSDGKNGTWMSINFCWGVAVLMGIYCSEGISGAHLNPAVTFTHAVYGRMSWWKVPGYAAAQTLGAFFGAAVVFVLNYQRIKEVDPTFSTTQGNFATYPAEGLSNLTGFYTELLATGMLLLGIYAITDERNRPAGPIATPFSFALLIMALGMAFGMNTGYALNPARDLGPRVFTWMAGYGSKVFTLNDGYFWIPLVGPCVGGVIGAGAYNLLVEIHHPQE
jgi:aquaporin-7